MPQLRKAAQRLRLDTLMDTLDLRHLDLFQCFVKTVRLPIPELGLGSVATYYGIPKLSLISDGFEAQWCYAEYRRCRAKRKRRALKARLIEYNHDDLEALAGIAERLGALRRP